MKIRFLIWSGILALLLTASAHAFLPYDGENYEITFPGDQFTPVYEPAVQGELANSSPAWRSFTATLAPGWRAFYWNQAADIPQFAAGAPIAGLAPGTYDESQIAAHGLDFIGRIKDLIRVAPEDLRFTDMRVMGDKAFSFFTQYYSGLPVFTSQLRLGYFHGALNSMEPTLYPDIHVELTPVLDEARAGEAAHGAMPWNPETDTIGEIQLGILPLVWGTETAYFLAYQVHFTTSDPPGEWIAYVDARDGDIFWRENTVSYYTITGTVRGDVKPRRADDPYQNMPMDDQKVTADSHTAYTDQDGAFEVTVSGNQYYTVTDYDEGHWVRVYDTATGTYPTLTQSAAPYDPAEFYWDDTNSDSPERSCFHHVNTVHAWLKSIDPDWTGCDQAITCRVNVDCTCNGYWQGGTINFCSAGSGCNNTGEIADVIFHEYHHWVTYRTYNQSPPSASTGIGEGSSDYCAMTLANDWCMSPSFYSTNPDGCLRSGLNLRQYPAPECGGEEHCVGEITGGAMWKTRRNLVEKHGIDFVHQVDVFFREALVARPMTVPTLLTALLTANDDNGNLADGTPDYYEICDAWGEHNVDCPAITRYIDFTHTPLTDTENTSNPILVRSVITSVGGAGNILEDSTKVFYSFDGVNYQAAPMTFVGSSTYEGYIQPMASKLVDYYIRSVTDIGIVGTEPIRAPEVNTYRFLIGPVSSVFADDLETDQGWTIRLPDDDATDGLWERIDPGGKQYNGEWVQPENDHTPGAGTRCFVTDGRGGYYTNYDVDAGRTSLLSPPLDLSACGDGYIDFYAFLATFGPVDDDSLMVYISPDGENWRLIWQIHNDGWNNPSFTHQKAYLRRDDFGGSGSARFKIIAEDNENNTITEAAIDDFSVLMTGGASGVDDVAGRTVALWAAPATPSPFSTTTAIRFQNPVRQEVDLTIFDVGGRAVRGLMSETLAAGQHTVQWDGRNDAGQLAPTGIYYYMLRAGDSTITRELVLTR